MSEVNAKAEKTDHKDCGPMGKYDDENKPVCVACESLTWVVSVGRDGNWNWSCTNCTKEWPK